MYCIKGPCTYNKSVELYELIFITKISKSVERVIATEVKDQAEKNTVTN